MAVTIAADWTEIGIGETGPGSPVVIGLEEIAQALHKGQSENVRSVLAQGGAGAVAGAERLGIVETAVGAVDRYRGDVLCWADDINVRLHVYGQNVIVDGTLGGIGLTAVTCGAVAWYSSAIVRISGMTRGADGETVLVLNGIADGAGTPHEWEWWILEEVADELAYLPDSTHADTDFQRIDDVAFEADKTLDGWLLGTLARNARELQRVRSRGTGLIHPIAEPWTTSSVHRRADGPYLISAAPYESEGIVVVRVAAVNYDVAVMAYSELEGRSFEALLTTRAVTVVAGAGETVLVFDGLLMSTLGNTAVWIHMQSEIAPADTAYSPSTLTRIQPVQARSEVEASDADWSTNEPQSWPVGRAVILGTRDLGLDPSNGEKYLTSDFPSTTYDLATNVRDDTAATSLIVVSPSFDFVAPPWTGAATGSADTYACGILQIYSVYVGAHPPAEETVSAARFRRLCSIGDYPPSGVINGARKRTNEATVYGSAALCTRHMGQQWHVPSDTTVGVKYQRGRYIFLKLSTAWGVLGRCAIPSDPRSGAGLDVDRLVADVMLMLVKTSYPQDDQLVDLALVAGGGIDERRVLLPSVFAHSKHSSITSDDAAIAAVTQAYDSVFGVTGDAWEHAYVQQLGWSPDTFERGHFDEVLGLEATLPGAYPLFAQIYIRAATAAADLWAVCPGFSCRYGHRV